MKYFVIFLIFVGFFGIVYAQPIPEPAPVCGAGMILKNGACVSADGPVCGSGTTYQDGMCVVDKVDNSTKIPTDPSQRWGGPYTYDVESPLKQFKSGISIDEIQCKTGLEHTIKVNDFKRFYCTSPDTKQILIKRGWAFDESKACRNPIDCFDSGISLDKTVYPEPQSNSEINRSCMTLEQSKDIAPFFKVPSYLPEGYSMKC